MKPSGEEYHFTSNGKLLFHTAKHKTLTMREHLPHKPEQVQQGKMDGNTALF